LTKGILQSIAPFVNIVLKGKRDIKEEYEFKLTHHLFKKEEVQDIAFICRL